MPENSVGRISSVAETENTVRRLSNSGTTPLNSKCERSMARAARLSGCLVGAGTHLHESLEIGFLLHTLTPHSHSVN